MNINGQFIGFWNGLIDEVEVFNRALSDSEIQAIYSAGSAGKCKTCTAPLDWWPAEGNANDIKGSNNGTLQTARPLRWVRWGRPLVLTAR